MKWSVRKRLLISHFLPILFLVPLLGFVLISLIRTYLVFPILSSEMINQGVLVAQIVKAQPSTWDSPQQAQSLLNSIPPQPPTRIGLLDPQGILLATNRPDDRSLVGQKIASPPSGSQASQPPGAVTSNQAGEPVLAVLVLVTNQDGTLLGMVRVYRRIADIQQIFTNLNLIVIGGLVVGLFLSTLIAFLVSANFNSSLQHLTQQIIDAPLEGQAQPLPEEGDEELHALVRAFNRLQERRQELERNREAMLANLIHEMGRPLGSLRSAVYALQVGAVEDPDLRTDLLKGMTERLARMGLLLQDLSLTYRKLAPQELNLRLLSVKDWLSELTPLWAQNAHQSELDWQCIIEENLPLVQVDPERLAQALSNMVSNAIKYTPAGGAVSLIVSRKENEIVFAVQDSGPGISSEDQSHLFTPFYRAGNVSLKAPGLGLGLSISRAIVKSMSGTISVESKPGRGSTFSIHLPIY